MTNESGAELDAASALQAAYYAGMHDMYGNAAAASYGAGGSLCSRAPETGKVRRFSGFSSFWLIWWGFGFFRVFPRVFSDFGGDSGLELPFHGVSDPTSTLCFSCLGATWSCSWATRTHR